MISKLVVNFYMNTAIATQAQSYSRGFTADTCPPPN